MMPIDLQRLSTRYALIIAVVLLLGMAFVLTLSGYFVVRGTDELRDELSTSLSQVHREHELESIRASSTYLAQRLFNPLYNLDITTLNAEIKRINDWLEPRSVNILDAEGRVVTDGTDENAEHGQQQQIPDALRSQASLIETRTDGQRLFFRIAHNGVVIGYVRILLSEAREQALLQGLNERIARASRRLERSFVSIAAYSLVIVFFASLLIAWRLSRTLSRPLLEMSHAAEQFAAGNLGHQLPARATDELGRLANSLNGMARDLAKANRLAYRAQEIAAFGSWEWRPANNELRTSHGVNQIFGLAPTAKLARIEDFLAFLEASDRDHFAGVLRGTLDTPFSIEVSIRRGDGETRRMLVKGESEQSDDGLVTVCFGTIQDITEQQRVQEQLTRLANFDTLTGLPNRNLFYDRLSHALLKARRQGSSVALFFLDLDRFKEINDALGHDVGDLLLRMAAERLQEAVRDCDTLARMGGDEFTLIIEDACTGMAPQAIARKLIDALQAPFFVVERELFVSASLGIALFPDDANDLETLIKHADVAMYAAKSNGRSAFHFFTAELQEAANLRLTLEHQLRHAIEDREIVLHFQPQVRASDHRLVGIEALMRWHDPKLAVPPSHFVPVLEETGLITQLTAPLLRESCAALQAIRAHGFLDARVAVNLSARQLQQPELLNLIESTLDVFELHPEQLEIEITESTLLDNELCQSNAVKLRAFGARLAIDDFGTGYSSLTYLKRFDVDALKIDRSFVQDMLDDPDDAQIVKAVVGLAAGLGIDSVGEGVEQVAQSAWLASIGCDLLQGYSIAYPMPLNDLLAWLRTQHGAEHAALHDPVTQTKSAPGQSVLG
jgi:diguanylate cyclase (GGDEF)-like protein/PAS domain S-box-containing protein